MKSLLYWKAEKELTDLGNPQETVNEYKSRPPFY